MNKRYTLIRNATAIRDERTAPTRDHAYFDVIDTQASAKSVEVIAHDLRIENATVIALALNVLVTAAGRKIAIIEFEHLAVVPGE